ncbi:MAG TPA: hypothetical protein VK081_03185 [Planctomycetota bacterium]|nr:hypothetical protein [Planctomycetota bacterium]
MQFDRTILLLAALASGAAAQTELYMPASRIPANQELGSYRVEPFMQRAARVQMFYDATEAGAASFVATRMSFRFDGPIPAVGAPGPFRIQRVVIRVGTTTVGIPGPVFGDNLSHPLTTVFDGPATFWPDQGSIVPEPWGGLNDGLTFAFNQPVSITIPPGGFFVIDMSVDGNDIDGRGHALVDAAIGSGGAVNGVAFSSDLGCSVTPNGSAATIATSGTHAPGGVHSIHGTNLGANAPVFAIVGASDAQASFGQLPLPVPGTSCTIYTSWDIILPLQANASGEVPEFAPGSHIAIPALPWFQHVTLYEQLVSYVPGANPWGLVFSDKRTVQLGTLTPPNPGFYAVSHSADAFASVADDTGPHGYALRVTTQ